MTKTSPTLTITSHKQARELTEAFREILDMEAWNKLRRFVAFMQLSAGQRALANPAEVQHWRSWSEGVGFMLNVVEDAIDQVEVFESEETEEEDKEILEYLDFGGADPG